MTTATAFELLERIAALLRSEERRKCSELGLQPVHVQVLDYLSRCNRYSDTPAALTKYLGMTKGTVSQTLRLLEKKGFIKKITDTSDRRIIHLQLLESGKTILLRAKPSDLFNWASQFLDNTDLFRSEEIFVLVLTALQKANKYQSFGLCKNCRYFTVTANGFVCGLTQEKLTINDSEKICQEHTLS